MVFPQQERGQTCFSVGIKTLLESTASCYKKMSTPTKVFWKCIPKEILAHIFSYLPFEDRHMAFSICQCWAEAVSFHSVWRFTEISCDTESMDNECMLERLHQYLCRIKHLKVVLDQSRQLYRRHAAQILDILNWQSHRLRALCIECYGVGPYYYSGQDILQNFRSLFENTGKIDLHYIDLRQTPYTLDNGMIQLIATSSPNLHTLLINNHPSGVIILRPKTITEVLRVCPKLSVLGVYHVLLSEDVFRELLKPNRRPFRFLDIYCDSLDHNIPERLWSALTEKHPQLRVGLEFDLMVPAWEMTTFLMPNIPIVALQFNTFMYTSRQIQYVTDSYNRTLERLVFDTTPSDDLNDLLIELAKRCVCLKEIHCYCAVSQAVIDAFLLNCPGLIRYTLSMH
ncbi:F-box/LRR-repeat protein 8-like isoform X4 [Hemicordylus capensis]|uniref:F-box/LRR-repeat protein 8-like isoform X4 n=1 Tax=Hemicordylus capensis TaxID=884348 RepID=UPI0023044A83|nr:F-box/LRR-repeat protein 8-like isoform X4 [Hemicordylus capensis]XP_053126782.1 F-box/LRR-repeat protein 8-like isoform X4 [Hemicordylus capensis]